MGRSDVNRSDDRIHGKKHARKHGRIIDRIYANRVARGKKEETNAMTENILQSVCTVGLGMTSSTPRDESRRNRPRRGRGPEWPGSMKPE